MPSEARIGVIVEGHGEIEAVPLLIRRCAQHIGIAARIFVPKPVRVPRNKLDKPHELERAIQLAANKAGDGCGILILADADDGCPASEGPKLLQRGMQQANGRFPVSVVLANSEFETWFLASAASLAGQRGLAADLTPPASPESIRDAKGWLSARMTTPEKRYAETIDQPALTQFIDFDAAAARSSSFDKMFRDVSKMLRDLTGAS